jgi:predicted RNA-binding protein with PIN domain
VSSDGLVQPEAPSADEPLPDAVRRRVLELAAEALGTLPAARVPTALVGVRKFAPARRASAGATPLASTLERDDGFRSEVALAIRQADPALVEALDAGQVPAAADPVQVAAASYLLRQDGWQEVLHSASHQVRQRAAQILAQQDSRELVRLREELARALADVEAVRAEGERRAEELSQELDDVRRELRRHRSDADRARAEARAAQAAAAARTATAEREVELARQRADRAEAEQANAREALEVLRRADKEGRSLAGSRARLLLDTVVDAAVGLRRELGLPPADVLPADLVGSPEPADLGGGVVAARAREDDDPARLTELLLMPQAHLVVDGYNVTKAAYGELPLADQRARLVSGLSALAARTRAEVTCCFDGAVVEGRVAAPSARGVRVRFSAPGQTADELIRRLVRAEPSGRVVVVVSSDREVADGVRAAGARPVPSAALARLLARG